MENGTVNEVPAVAAPSAERVREERLKEAAPELLKVVEEAIEYIAALPHSRAGSDVYLALMDARNLAVDGTVSASMLRKSLGVGRRT